MIAPIRRFSLWNVPTLSLALALLASGCVPSAGDQAPGADGTEDPAGAEDVSQENVGEEDGGEEDVGGEDTGGEAPEDPGSDGGGPPEEEDPCGLPAGSPPSVVIDGTRRVPIDVLSLHADLMLDAGSQSGRATAQLRFAMGTESGWPVFDLRQTITSIMLDGVTLTPDDAVYFEPMGNYHDRMRSVAIELEPCTEHTLEIEYTFRESDAFCSSFPDYADGGVTWLDHANDLQPACFLEQWFPGNLPHDELDIDIDIAVIGTAVPHTLITNGAIEERGANDWHLDFPSRFTSMSPMMAVVPAANVERQSSTIDLPDGQTLTIEVYKTVSYDVQMADIQAATAEALRKANSELGPYIHGDRYVVFANEHDQDMEYDGATSTSLEEIEHEVFHSWIGRGLRPLTSRDGWLDEAWTQFSVDNEFSSSPLTLEEDSPAVLAPEDRWVRKTSIRAYGTGARLFTNIANEIGLPALRELLRNFYIQNAGQFVTTEQLEQHLYCETSAEVVRAVFHRYVYGREDELPTLPTGYCD